MAGGSPGRRYADNRLMISMIPIPVMPPLKTAIGAGFLLLGLALTAPSLAAPAATPPADFPDYAQVKADWRSSEARFLDRHGRLIEEVRIDPAIRRTDWTPLADISPALIAAVLRAEDRRFFRHAGVDWLAAGKAALTNWLNEKPRGASTLTMQLAALLDGQYRAQAGRRDVVGKIAPDGGGPGDRTTLE
jgi:penicillin-binding protein 1C